MSLERVNECLSQLIPEDSSTLHQAARYALLGGGKRIRPLFLLSIAEHYGADTEKALIPACALEMIHAYSLIHDDLPCMDDDDFRRGMPTVHRKFDEATAVLAGDFLLTYAFEVLATRGDFTPAQRLAFITALSQYAGGNGMIGGQMLDLEAENRSISLDELATIHSKKTGALFAAAAVMAGIVAEVDPSELERLRAYGFHYGLAFQILDDVKDVTDSSKHGNVSSDIRNQKSTYVSLMGLEKAKELAQQEIEKAEALVRQFI